MKFKPTRYNNQAIDAMSDADKGSYHTFSNDLVATLMRSRKADDEYLAKLLEKACEYDMLFYPDGNRVSLKELKGITANKKTMLAGLSDLVLASYDPRNGTTSYRSLNVGDSEVSVPRHAMTDDEFFEKQQEYIAKKYNTEQADKIKAMDKDQRKAYFSDMDYVFGGLCEDGIKLKSDFLKLRLEYAIKRDIVRLADGHLLNKNQVDLIARTPAYLKYLVFTQRTQDHYRDRHETYRLIVEDGKVKMDYTKQVTPLEIAEMEKKLASLDKREDVPGLYVQAMEPRNQEKLDKYIAEMIEYGYDIEHYAEAHAIRVLPEKDVYLYGNPTPIKTPDELMSAKGVEPPKEPNSWGIFEGIRRTWHKLFGNVAVYEKYEDDLKQYEIDKYHAAKEVGFKVDDQKETVERYERELAEKREAAKPKIPQDLEEALKVVRACLDEEQPSDFYRSIEAALKENTEFGSIMRKGLANMEYDNLNGFYRKNELLLAKKQFETDKDSPVLKHYEKYAAVYACGFQRAFTGKVFKNKELNFAREVNLLVEKACSAASKLSKANPNMAPDKLQAKIDAAMQKRVDTFKDLAKDAVKDDLNTFMEDLYNAERAIASSEEQKAGKVTDVAKAQAATQKIMEGEAEKQGVNVGGEEKQTQVVDLDEVLLDGEVEMNNNEVGGNDEIQQVNNGPKA